MIQNSLDDIQKSTKILDNGNNLEQQLITPVLINNNNENEEQLQQNEEEIENYSLSFGSIQLQPSIQNLPVIKEVSADKEVSSNMLNSNCSLFEFTGQKKKFTLVQSFDYIYQQETPVNQQQISKIKKIKSNEELTIQEQPQILEQEEFKQNVDQKLKASCDISSNTANDNSPVRQFMESINLQCEQNSIHSGKF